MVNFYEYILKATHVTVFDLRLKSHGDIPASYFIPDCVFYNHTDLVNLFPLSCPLLNPYPMFKI